jgi:hypothetical protein
MPFVLAGERLIHFAHVPKTGGTSVETYLRSRFGELFLYSPRPIPREASKRSLLTTPQHLTAQDVSMLLPRDPDLAFAVVREPLARAISEFRYQSAFNYFCRLGFGMWLRVVLHASRIEPRLYDNHLRPQTDFLSKGMAVFRLEDGLDRIVAWLDEELGAQAPGVKMTHEKISSKVSVQPSREDVALIARVYAIDYIRCGYKPPNPASYPPDRLAGWRSLLARRHAYRIVLRNWCGWLR